MVVVCTGNAVGVLRTVGDGTVVGIAFEAMATAGAWVGSGSVPVSVASAQPVAIKIAVSKKYRTINVGQNGKFRTLGRKVWPDVISITDFLTGIDRVLFNNVAECLTF